MKGLCLIVVGSLLVVGCGGPAPSIVGSWAGSDAQHPTKWTFEKDGTAREYSGAEGKEVVLSFTYKVKDDKLNLIPTSLDMPSSPAVEGMLRAKFDHDEKGKQSVLKLDWKSAAEVDLLPAGVGATKTTLHRLG